MPLIVTMTLDEYKQECSNMFDRLAEDTVRTMSRALEAKLDQDIVLMIYASEMSKIQEKINAVKDRINNGLG